MICTCMHCEGKYENARDYKTSICSACHRQLKGKFELKPVTIDDFRNMDCLEKEAARAHRRRWLKESRKRDKKEVRRAYTSRVTRRWRRTRQLVHKYIINEINYFHYINKKGELTETFSPK